MSRFLIVLVWEIRITEGMIKSPFLEDTAVQGEERREVFILYNQRNFHFSKKSDHLCP